MTSNNTILVTGGAGYIGSHTCVELLQAGFDLVVVDNFSNSKPEALQRVMQITGREFACYAVDITHTEALSQVFTDHPIDAVVHFAGLKAVGESCAKPAWYYRNNVYGTQVLTEVMAEHHVKRLVFSSSATVYGEPKSVPITEDFPLSATNPYGRSKWFIESMLSDFVDADRLQHANQPWQISVLRYFNPIGAHKSGLIGEDPKDIPNNLMPYISQVAVGKLKQLSVFGDDYPTHDGTGVRDYIHVVDLAKGHVKALEKLFNQAQETTDWQAYNLGTGQGYSVLDLVKTFIEVTGQDIPYQIAPRRPGDIAICYADPTKAWRELGWQAQLDLTAMLADTWRWQSSNPDGYA
ncbi:MAG: UDP-glucose 4-epimerase GalE [Methylococcales bacterium]|nr:UDP-glucose 4-epimerase GalE [Methylococcales bacterium]